MTDHVIIDYTNWRGERRKRTIIPLHNGLEFKSTKYHLEQQWLLRAFDVEDRMWKDFAMRDVHSWEPVT